MPGSAGRGLRRGSVALLRDFQPPRSLLFFPGNDARKFERAAGSPADVVVADMEDAVPDGDKHSAREQVARFIAEPNPAGPVRAVRINSLDSPHAAADLELIREIRPGFVIVPKASAAELQELGPLPWEPALVAIIETPGALRETYEIAATPGVSALMLGGVDLADSLRLRPRKDGLDLLYPRSRLVIDSAAAGLPAPLDGVYTRLDDEEGLLEECSLVRSLGFGGKACIHPKQIDAINRTFGPDDAEIAWAQRVVTAYAEAAAEGRGAIRLDGEMVDLPVVTRAEAILAAHRSRSDDAVLP